MIVDWRVVRRPSDSRDVDTCRAYLPYACVYAVADVTTG